MAVVTKTCTKNKGKSLHKNKTYSKNKGKGLHKNKTNKILKKTT